VPRRRCVGCGRIAPKAELTRIALSRDGADRSRQAVHDRDGSLPGRGAYLCRARGAAEPAAACLALAMRRGAIPRALRSAVTLDPKLVESVSR
jgi:predicted RNA-binding protein YlxR (DUF448 family)